MLVQILVELEKLFVVVEHELANREQLAEIARGSATGRASRRSGAHLGTTRNELGG